MVTHIQIGSFEVNTRCRFSNEVTALVFLHVSKIKSNLTFYSEIPLPFRNSIATCSHLTQWPLKRCEFKVV